MTDWNGLRPVIVSPLSLRIQWRLKSHSSFNGLADAVMSKVNVYGGGRGVCYAIWCLCKSYNLQQYFNKLVPKDRRCIWIIKWIKCLHSKLRPHHIIRSYDIYLKRQGCVFTRVSVYKCHGDRGACVTKEMVRALCLQRSIGPSHPSDIIVHLQRPRRSLGAQRTQPLAA